MGKYTPLKSFLEQQNRDRIPMTFAEIEHLLKLPLPPSKQYPAWWSNNPSNNPMTREWLEAGFETEAVNVGGERLVFRRVHKAPDGGLGGSSRTPRGGPAASAGRHPLFGCMKGMLTPAPGVDLTEPADPDFADHLDDKYGPEVRRPA